MLKKLVKKLFLFILCFAFATPFLGASISVAYANENYDEVNAKKTVFVGVEYKFSVLKNVDSVSLSDVIVYGDEGASANYDDTKIAFKEGKDCNDNDCYVVSFSSAGNVLGVTFTKTGTFHLKVQEKKDNPISSTSYEFTVVEDVSKIELNYVDKASNASKYEKYLESVNTAVNGTDGENKLKLGKNFEVPSVDGIISTQIPYNSINKQVYYCVPGNENYSSTSALSGTPKFKVSAYGKYVYYVLLSVDSLTNNDSNSIKMTVDYLKEEVDGFYEYVIENTTTKVYYSTETKKFYATEDEAKEGEGTEITNAVKGKLVVPKFTFELENEGPVIDITSTYQENGHIGAVYKLTSITVNGSESTTYTLYYKENANATAVDVTKEENFDASVLSFTPTKKGIYYVHVSAVDSVGKTAEATTAEITVVNRYQTVKYKASFGDWLEKNTLPFVLLCVSGACLIAIICLLFIKPKDATAKKPLKKVDENEVDR